MSFLLAPGLRLERDAENDACNVGIVNRYRSLSFHWVGYPRLCGDDSKLPSVATNPLTPGTFNVSWPISYILYTDCNSLDGVSMLQPLPYSDFRCFERVVTWVMIPTWALFLKSTYTILTASTTFIPIILSGNCWRTCGNERIWNLSSPNDDFWNSFLGRYDPIYVQSVGLSLRHRSIKFSCPCTSASRAEIR